MSDKHFKLSKSTSWQPVSKWYAKTVGESGHYFHQHAIIPKVLELLSLDSKSSLLDAACGQGVLERAIPQTCYYQGLDISPSLIKYAGNHRLPDNHFFKVADLNKSLPIPKTDFTHAVIILALQNIENPLLTLKNIGNHLTSKGKLIVVLNHPCFRIPRQSSWEIDPVNKIQYRRINRYLTSLKIPIQANPGAGQRSSFTWSFHHSLSDFSRFLSEAGFIITLLEEWGSDKVSVGKAAKMENLSRSEFPLFLTIVAEKR